MYHADSRKLFLRKEQWSFKQRSKCEVLIKYVYCMINRRIFCTEIKILNGMWNSKLTVCNADLDSVNMYWNSGIWPHKPLMISCSLSLSLSLFISLSFRLNCNIVRFHLHAQSSLDVFLFTVNILYYILLYWIIHHYIKIVIEQVTLDLY